MKNHQCGTLLMSDFCNAEAKYYTEQLWEPSNSEALDYLRSRGFKDETLKRFEIGFCPSDGGYFKNRIVFPIFDTLGNVRGFSGRALPGTSTIKYMNSKESEDFSKSRCLFGLFHHQKGIFVKNRVIFVEGFTDVLALAQEGSNNVVAGMGVALTDPQLALIARYTRNITLCFDSDEKGTAAFHKSVKRAKEFGFSIKRVKLPEGKDPADLLIA